MVDRARRAGARPVGLDNSARQLEHARRLMAEAGVDFPLVHASAEEVPLRTVRFDIVFCDHGAMTFADPYRTVPEAARLLRPGGLFAFSHHSPIETICWELGAEVVGDRLVIDYFGMHRVDDGEDVFYQLPYGEWIRLFRANGFVIEDLIEPRPAPGATSSYRQPEELEWARRWPAESIWRLRRTADTDSRAGRPMTDRAVDPYDATPRPAGRVHIVGAGPVGLFLAALLQSIDGQRVRLYERRPEYTRTRMVMLAPYLVADSIETYQADVLDGPNVEAIFDPAELETRLAYRRTVAADLKALLQEWTLGFVALKTIEQSLARPHRAPGNRHGRARRRRGHARRRAREARAGRHRRRHHGHAVPVPRCPRPGWRRTGPPEPDAGPPRVRAGRDVPLQPALRLQRVLQVRQERREHRVQVHPRRCSARSTTGRSAT